MRLACPRRLVSGDIRTNAVVISMHAYQNAILVVSLLCRLGGRATSQGFIAAP